MKLEILESSFINKNLSDEEYFSEENKEYISNSQLGLINKAEGGDPIKFLRGFKSVERNSLLLGTAIHRMTLEKDVYELSEVVRPGGKLGNVIYDIFKFRKNNISIIDAIKASFISNNYYVNSITEKRISNVIKEGFEYYRFLKKSDESKISLNNSNKEIAQNCLTSVLPYFVKKEGVEEFNEFPIFGTFLYFHTKLNKFVCVKLKCKIDKFEIDHNKKKITLIDLKTTGSSVTSFISEDYIKINEEGTELVKAKSLGSFFKYHYYRQMAMYLWMLKQYCIEKLNISDYTYDVKMVVVETNTPNRAKEFDISENLIKLGEEEFVFLLEEVLFYQDKGFDYMEY